MLKKAGITFYINAAASVLVLVGFIFTLISNSKPGFAFSNGTAVILLSVLGVIAFCGTALSELKFGSHSLITFCIKTIAVVAIAIAFSFMLENRIVDIVNLTSWDTENAVGWSAFYTGAVAIALYLVSVITFIVTSFLKGSKA